MSTKIQATHLKRKAVIYLRQSTIQQVVEHSESTRRQYALRERAEQLGWLPGAIEAIDEDLGCSGTTTVGRSGFQRLGEEVSCGLVGAIFVLEVSRLARSSADWHRLLDLCSVADVVLVDEQTVYEPADPNDRLVLGLKGTMSEAEQNWMQLRLRGARISKARRGELYMPPPIGYLWDRATACYQMDPDQEIQAAIRMIFDRFRLQGSAWGVMRFMIEHGLRIPGREAATADAQVRWSEPRPSRILSILHNPTYAGAYVYGRRKRGAEIVDGEMKQSYRRLPIDQWAILLRERHPGYISWEDYVENQRRLAQNRPHRDEPAHQGAARQGDALLQGLVICGRCGHRMYATYSGRGRKARYICLSPSKQGRSNQSCWSVAAGGIDDEAARQFLEVVQPPEVELGMAVSQQANQQADELDQQWQLRIERAEYEARLAERRYKAVDPDNRIVARTLEEQWEDKLSCLHELNSQYQELRREKKVELGSKDRERIVELSRQLGTVWKAESTTMRDRKNLLRVLVDHVCLSPIDEIDDGTRLEILWKTGAVTQVVVQRQRPGKPNDPQAVALMRELVSEMVPAAEIARQLNEAGFKTARENRWTSRAVHAYCQHHDIKWPEPMPTSLPNPDRREDGLYSVRGVAKLLDVTDDTVRYWVSQGWIDTAEGGGRGRPRWFELDEETIEYLTDIREAHTGPRGRRNSNRLSKGDAL